MERFTVNWNDLGRDVHMQIIGFAVNSIESMNTKEEMEWMAYRNVCKSWKECIDSLFPFDVKNCLIRACKRGSFQSIKWFVSMNRVDLRFDGDNLLVVASQAGDLKVIKYLMELGLDPSSKFSFSLRMAAETGHIHVVEFLLKDGRVNPQVAIGVAAEFGHLEICERLMATGIDPSFDNNYAVRKAAQRGHERVVDFLLKDERVDPTASIVWAASEGRWSYVETMLKNPKCKIGNQNTSWEHLMGLCVIHDQFETFKKLLYDPRTRDANWLAWMYAERESKMDFFDELIKSKVKVGKELELELKHALDSAVMYGKVELLRYLNQLNPIDEETCREISKMAISDCQMDVIMFLKRELGYHPDEKTWNFSYGVHGNLHSIEYLLERGIPFNHFETIYKAVRKGDIEVAERILDVQMIGRDELETLKNDLKQNEKVKEFINKVESRLKDENE